VNEFTDVRETQHEDQTCLTRNVYFKSCFLEKYSHGGRT